MLTRVDKIVGICRYCRRPVTDSEVEAGRVVVALQTPEGGNLYEHAGQACVRGVKT
jgi:hypothetical protein